MTELPAQRVLMVAPEPFFTPRGTPMNVAQMCRVLTSKGLQIDLVTYPLGEPFDLPGLTIHRAPGIPGIRSVPIGFSWRKVMLDISLFFKLLSLLVRKRYSFVHAIEESVFLVLPLTWLGVSMVYDLDSLISDQLKYSGTVRARPLLRGARWLERTALRRSIAAITVCQALSDAVRDMSPATSVFQVEDCPLQDSLRPPDPDAVEAIRERLGLAGRQTIVYTGNLESYQGMDLLLDSAAILADSHPAATFLLLGGSKSDVDKLQQSIASRSLSGSIRCLGHQPSTDLPEWMDLADVLVSPRVQGDNTPLKIYTYMYTAKPIVATDLLTHTQVLDGSMAILTAPTPEGLAAGLGRALDQPEEAQQLGTKARQIAQAEYGQEAFADKLLAAYNALLTDPSFPDRERVSPRSD